MFLGTDPSLMVKLGNVYSLQGDDARALRMFQDAFQVMPASMDVAMWLGVYHVKGDQYAEALRYFELLAQLQPSEVKWELMAASCVRRGGDVGKAYERYKEVNARHKDNVECLRYLCDLSRELGFADEERRHAEHLARAQKAQAQAEAADAAAPKPKRAPVEPGYSPTPPAGLGVRAPRDDDDLLPDFGNDRSNVMGGAAPRKARGRDEEDWTLDEDLLPM